eukprot:Skav218324  [mRNA]  locus=scaffold2239:237399:241429:+ [translate_table: standard]
MEEITGGTGVFILSSEAQGEERLQGVPDNAADLTDFFQNDRSAIVFKACWGIELTRTKILEQILQFFRVPLDIHILYGMFHGFPDGSWKLADGNSLTFDDVIGCWEAAKEAQQAHHLQIFVDSCYGGSWVHLAHQRGQEDIFVQAACGLYPLATADEPIYSFARYWINKVREYRPTEEELRLMNALGPCFWPPGSEIGIGQPLREANMSIRQVRKTQCENLWTPILQDFVDGVFCFAENFSETEVVYSHEFIPEFPTQKFQEEVDAFRKSVETLATSLGRRGSRNDRVVLTYLLEMLAISWDNGKRPTRPDVVRAIKNDFDDLLDHLHLENSCGPLFQSLQFILLEFVIFELELHKIFLIKKTNRARSRFLCNWGTLEGLIQQATQKRAMLACTCLFDDILQQGWPWTQRRSFSADHVRFGDLCAMKGVQQTQWKPSYKGFSAGSSWGKGGAGKSSSDGDASMGAGGCNGGKGPGKGWGWNSWDSKGGDKGWEKGWDKGWGKGGWGWGGRGSCGMVDGIAG